MTEEAMFFCIPQQAYMATANCRKLRDRPVGKVPAGSQPRLSACENCQMYPLVDTLKVPTVGLKDYLGGGRPKVANLNSTANKKMIQEHMEQLEQQEQLERLEQQEQLEREAV